MNDGPGRDVGQSADDEDGGVVVAVGLEDPTGDPLEEHAAHGARESADPDHRPDRRPGKHVARQRIDVGGPGLVRRRRDAHDRHRRPHAPRQRRERRRHDQERHREQRRLPRPVHGPAVLDQGAREPTAPDRSDVRHQIYDDQRSGQLCQPDAVLRVEKLREPVQIEPPDRIGEEFPDRERPGLPIREQPNPGDDALRLLS